MDFAPSLFHESTRGIVSYYFRSATKVLAALGSPQLFLSSYTLASSMHVQSKSIPYPGCAIFLYDQISHLPTVFVMQFGPASLEGAHESTLVAH